MHTDDRLEIINHWTHEFSTETSGHTGKWCGRVVFTKHSMRGERTYIHRRYDDMVECAYRKVHEYIWGFVNQVELERAMRVELERAMRKKS